MSPINPPDRLIRRSIGATALEGKGLNLKMQLRAFNEAFDRHAKIGGGGNAQKRGIDRIRDLLLLILVSARDLVNCEIFATGADPGDERIAETFAEAVGLIDPQQLPSIDRQHRVVHAQKGICHLDMDE